MTTFGLDWGSAKYQGRSSLHGERARCSPSIRRAGVRAHAHTRHPLLNPERGWKAALEFCSSPFLRLHPPPSPPHLCLLWSFADCGRQMAGQRYRHTAYGSWPEPRGSGSGEGDSELVSAATETLGANAACFDLCRCSGGQYASYFRSQLTPRSWLPWGNFTDFWKCEQVCPGSRGALVARTFRGKRSGRDNQRPSSFKAKVTTPIRLSPSPAFDFCYRAITISFTFARRARTLLGGGKHLFSIAHC